MKTPSAKAEPNERLLVLGRVDAGRRDDAACEGTAARTQPRQGFVQLSPHCEEKSPHFRLQPPLGAIIYKG